MISKQPLITLGFLSVAIFVIVFGQATSADAQKVHALLLIMDDDLDIRKSVDVNRLRVKKTLQLLDTNPEIWRADERQIQPNHIIKWVQNCQTQTEDTVFVYYSGHGHIDPEKRHYLNLDAQNSEFSLLRSDLVKALGEKNCRLKMLITDTCSQDRGQIPPIVVKSFGAVVTRKRRHVQNLFLQHKGFLDITAASPGQYAWGNNEIGGYFTAALVKSFTTDSDTDKDGFLSWEEVFSTTCDETEKLFSETEFLPIDRQRMDDIGQETQEPTAHTLPERLTQLSSLTRQISETIIGKDGAKMVLISAGEFQMGSNTGNADEKPVHSVYTDAFYMDVYEVTNAQYEKFIEANPQWRKDRIARSYHDGGYLKLWEGNSYPKDKENHPVVYVNWYAAMAYAEWANKRLPTEAEWEKAARGGLVGKTYPWGNPVDPSKANYDRNVGNTSPVGSYFANGHSLHDMAGNVFEWCLDAWTEDFYANSSRWNPIYSGEPIKMTSDFTNIKNPRVFRGGSWLSPLPLMRVAYRNRSIPLNTYSDVGFRCVIPVNP